MSELSRTAIAARLERLSDDLDRFPTGTTCPWAIARVFNELVKIGKRDLAEDPVMRSMRLIEEAPGESDLGTSNAAVGTVRALIGQVHVAYEQAGDDAAPKPRSTAKKPPAKRTA